MKGKSFLILVIVSLLAINAFILIRFYRFRQLHVEYITQYRNISEKDELHSYKVNFTTNILNSNLQLDSVMVKDSLNEIFPLEELFKGEKRQMLVCRFSTMHCESCVEFSIQMLRRQIKFIGIENVLFLGNYPNNRVFNKTKPLYGIHNLNVYNAAEFNIPAEELGYPYYFVLDSSLHISNVFVPDKATPNITDKYLESIRKTF
jgi:hypothetical protein